MKKELLKIRNLTKSYQTKKATVRALRGISLDIYEGEILGLLGINGAGKTTLSAILATLNPPTSGSIEYQETSIYENLIEYRKIMGFCPQKPNLDTYLNVEENLLFAGRYFLMPEHEIRERANELMEQFGLHEYKNFPVNALSGGWKQRLLISRALMHKPKLVILDEPTVGLDPDIRRNLWSLIKKLKEQNVSVVLTTHYLEEAEVLSDRLCILHKGKIVSIATVKDLKDKYKKNTLEDAFLSLTEEQDLALVQEHMQD